MHWLECRDGLHSRWSTCVVTPSEIENASPPGCVLQKFFPAEPAGGVAMLEAIGRPYAHTGIRFLPLGGISASNMPMYLRLPMVVAVGGSWIADCKLIAAEDWSTITQNASEAVDCAASADG